MKLVYGIGINKKERPAIGTRPYRIWTKILNEVGESKGRLSICRKFKNYTFFYDWYMGQVESDKDFKISYDLLDKSNTTFHYDKCVLLPIEISRFMNRVKKVRGNLPVGVDRTNKNSDAGFMSRISMGNERIHLGTYRTPEEAFMPYKLMKEWHIKHLAEKHKSSLDPIAYDALMNYTVDIID